MWIDINLNEVSRLRGCVCACVYAWGLISDHPLIFCYCDLFFSMQVMFNNTMDTTMGFFLPVCVYPPSMEIKLLIYYRSSELWIERRCSVTYMCTVYNTYIIYNMHNMHAILLVKKQHNGSNSIPFHCTELSVPAAHSVYHQSSILPT